MYDFTIKFYADDVPQKNISYLVNTFGVPNTIVEVGVYEGMTTCWMADTLVPHNKALQIYGIDPHSTSIDLHTDLVEVGNRFKNNIAASEFTTNIHYINSTSREGLLDLYVDGVRPELIYIDGDHTAPTVLEDLVLAFMILKPGGVILCDDSVDWKFKDKSGSEACQMSPRMAVDNFIHCNWHKIKVLPLPESIQTAFMKL